MIEAHSKRINVVNFLKDLIKTGVKAKAKVATAVNDEYAAVRIPIAQKLCEYVDSSLHRKMLQKHVTFESEYIEWERGTNWFAKLCTLPPVNDVEEKQGEAVLQTIERERETITMFLDNTGIIVLEECERYSFISIYQNIYSRHIPDIKNEIVKTVHQFMAFPSKRLGAYQSIRDLTDVARKMLDKINTYKYDTITLDDQALTNIKDLQEVIKKYS